MKTQVFVERSFSAMSWYGCGGQEYDYQATRKMKQTQHIIPFIGACSLVDFILCDRGSCLKFKPGDIFAPDGSKPGGNVQLLGLW